MDKFHKISASTLTYVQVSSQEFRGEHISLIYCFCHSFKGVNFYGLLFAFLLIKSLQKRGILLKARICSSEAVLLMEERICSFRANSSHVELYIYWPERKKKTFLTVCLPYRCIHLLVLWLSRMSIGWPRTVFSECIFVILSTLQEPLKCRIKSKYSRHPSRSMFKHIEYKYYT